MTQKKSSPDTVPVLSPVLEAEYRSFLKVSAENCAPVVKLTPEILHPKPKIPPQKHEKSQFLTKDFGGQFHNRTTIFCAKLRKRPIFCLYGAGEVGESVWTTFWFTQIPPPHPHLPYQNQNLPKVTQPNSLGKIFFSKKRTNAS